MINKAFSLKKTLVAVTAGVSLLLSTSSFAADKVYRLKLAETWGPNFPIFGDTTKNLADMVDKMSNGRLQIRIDSANKHKAPLGVFDMVKAGQYDIGHSASYYWKGKVPNTLYFTTMPFGMIAAEQYAWFYHGGGMELMEKVYSPHNLLSFPGGNTGVQMGGWFQKEINSVDDLKGLKMRIPGFAGEVLAELGASPTNIAPGELYTSLERRTIDALEWVGPGLDLRMGFHKIAPYYYTGWHEPATELQFLVNKRSFERLPEDLQQILVVAMRTSAYDMWVLNNHASGENWESMLDEYPNITVKNFPDEVLAAMRKSNDELLSQRAESDALAKEILTSQANYLKTIRPWTEISTQAYLEKN
ncbi:TRAP transporter substrate-binding protein [Thaumasiovibrio sp. DFM-14]|uniref:TRAP transporter substrate-binding protein n=1 Tax=Thaumasiovibrio sp. DFM-14 TaxID=3384792 RepID=UPI0039A38DBB